MKREKDSVAQMSYFMKSLDEILPIQKAWSILNFLEKIPGLAEDFARQGTLKN